MDIIKPIIVMGGAPSLLDDLKKCPADAIRISCNKHAALVTHADYIAMIDRTVNGHMHQRLIRQSGLNQPFIAPFDADIIHEPPDHPINTGIYAAWVACQMGAPVILAGIEFYQSGSEQTSIHGEGKVRRNNYTEKYLNQCINKLLKLTDGHKIYCCGGVLTNWLDQYDGESVV